MIVWIVSFFFTIGFGANIPSLIVVERENDTNPSLFAKYSWDTTGGFTRQELANIPDIISSAAYSQKKQLLFVFYNDTNNWFPHMSIYDLNGLHTDYSLVIVAGIQIQGSIYLDDTDELWVWYLNPLGDNPPTTCFTAIDLDGCKDGNCFNENVYKLLPLPGDSLTQYSLSGRLLYFYDTSRSLWSWDFDKMDLLVDPYTVGASAVFQDGLIYFQGWSKYNVHLMSYDSIGKKINYYSNQFPSFSYSVDKSSTSFIDDYYVTTIKQDQGTSIQYMLVFAPPGGVNFYQDIDKKVMWLWKFT